MNNFSYKNYTVELGNVTLLKRKPKPNVLIFKNNCNLKNLIKNPANYEIPGDI